VEGYQRAEWVLLDYFDFVVHVFGEETRTFYGLERLWGSATPVDLQSLLAHEPARP
jgi:ribosome-associated protein